MRNKSAQEQRTEFTCHHTNKFFHQRGVRELLLQTENITVFLNQRPDCLAQHRMKKRRSIRVQPTGKQEGNSPMQRGNPGRETQRGDWVLTPPLKRLLLVVLSIESISKILQLRLESLRLESLGVDVRTELVS